MFHTIRTAIASEALERATLLVNHVLSSEPMATQRLRPHVGRSLQLQLADWPAWLPPLPDLSFRITPAALVEWCGVQPPQSVDLQIRMDASSPAMAVLQVLSGGRPRVDVTGDAAFATDVNWLFDNLRWDVEDDLAKIVGAAPAHEMARLARRLAAGLRDAVGAVGAMASRARRPGQNP